MSDAAAQKQAEEDAMAAEWAAALAETKPEASAAAADDPFTSALQNTVDSVAPAKFTNFSNDSGAGATQLHGELHRDVQDHVDVVACARRRGRRKVGERRRSDLLGLHLRGRLGGLGLGERGSPFGGHRVLFGVLS